MMRLTSETSEGYEAEGRTGCHVQGFKSGQTEALYERLFSPVLSDCRLHVQAVTIKCALAENCDRRFPVRCPVIPCAKP